jgi:DNA/RNA-binding domain of Phe-tRNA-synthetase-like protein
MIYKVEQELFEMFPAFRRGVLIATGVDNSAADPETSRLLSTAARDANHDLSASERQRVDVWNAAYSRFGSDPNRYTPSIRFLHEQIRRGKPPRSISKLVDLFNVVSLKWMAPCGGDDLDSLCGGDLCLGFAHGDETFAPLFKPLATEHPIPREVIYYTIPTRRVLCRRWTWRNSDFSKIRPETKTVAINIDAMMPPLDVTDLEKALCDLTKLVERFCGGSTSMHILEPSNPQILLEGSINPGHIGFEGETNNVENYSPRTVGTEENEPMNTDEV